MMSLFLAAQWFFLLYFLALNAVYVLLIFAYILVLGVLGLIMDQLMRAVGRLLFRYTEERR